MIILSTLSILLTTLFYVSAVYVEAMVGNSVSAAGFKPQIAMRCGYYNQYYDRTGVWLSDSRGNCLTEAKDILEYCRSVYPDLNVTNVMESGSLAEVENWCQPNEIKCDKTFSVAPYRCLEGNFQSEALLVPEGCIFDHVHNGKACLPPTYWTHKAQQACNNRAGAGAMSVLTSRRMTVRSSSMLLPCKVGQFSGVEFVCCPSAAASSTKAPTTTTTTTTTTTDVVTEDDLTTTTEQPTSSPAAHIRDHTINGAASSLPVTSPSPPSSTVSTEGPQPGPTSTDSWSQTGEVGPRLKAYLDGFDKVHEHEAYVQAKKALRDKRRQNIVRIMEEWGMSEHRYQKLKETDPLAAEQFKKDITERFQKTITALEDEETAQKKQLIAVHEQRVTSLLNEKKREYMFDFLRELERSNPQAVSVKETLQKLLRTEEKDKMHVIHYYEHLLNTDPVAASKVKSMVAQHVTEIEHRMERSVKMLSKRLPTIYHQIYPQIKTYLKSIKTRNGDFEELTRSITNAERPALDTTFQVRAKPENSPLLPLHLDNQGGPSTTTPTTTNPAHRLAVSTTAAKQNETEDSVDEGDYDDDQDDDDDDYDDDSDSEDTDEDTDEFVTKTTPGAQPKSQFLPDNSLLLLKSPGYNGALGSHSSYAAKKLSDQQIHSPETANLRDDFINGNGGVRGGKRSSNQSFAFAWIVSLVAIAAFALIIVGLVLVRRKMHFNHPHNQHQPLPTHPGRKETDNVSNFVEVDNQSLEERHLANMQVNGYENPTYRYFEKIAPKA